MGVIQGRHTHILQMWGDQTEDATTEGRKSLKRIPSYYANHTIDSSWACVYLHALSWWCEEIVWTATMLVQLAKQIDRIKAI